MIFKNTKRKNTTQDSIPYTNIYANGVIETEEGVFTRAYKLDDANFTIASDLEQLSMIRAYGGFLNSFPLDTEFQLVCHNRVADKQDFLRKVQFSPKKDSLNPLRADFNRILAENVFTGKTNITQDKYLIVSHKDNDVAHAMQTLLTLDKTIKTTLSKVTKSEAIEPVSLTERLHCLYDIYNQGEGSFYNAYEGEKPIFDLKAVYQNNQTSKDAVAPSVLDFHSGYFQTGDFFGCSLYLEKLPAKLTTNFMADLLNSPYSMLTSVHYKPIDTQKSIDMVNSRMTALASQIAKLQKTASQDGYSAEAISPELYLQYENAQDTLNDLRTRDQKLFKVTLSVTVFAESLDTLEMAVSDTKNRIKAHQAPLKRLAWRQELGFNSCLPLCINELSKNYQQQTTEGSSVFFPYTTKELHDEDGIFYGVTDIPQTSKNVILYSRLNAKNFNGLIFGESGSGKSMSSKLEMLQVLCRDERNRVYIVDPEGEYSKIAKKLKDLPAQEIILSSGSNGAKQYINPLDMDLNYADDDSPLALKSDYIISMLEIMSGRGRIITPSEKSIIDRCTEQIFRGYLAQINAKSLTCDRQSMPTLTNLYNALRNQPETEAQKLASILELYSEGTLNTFAHRTTVNTDARLVTYNIRSLGSGMKELGLFVCLNDIWNKTIENRKKNLWTWFYIDEMHILLKSDTATDFLAQIWKRARKWQGVPTGILQNTQDLLSSERASGILNNTGFMMLHSLQIDDRTNLGARLDLSDSQLDYLTNATSGHGLIYTGRTCLPFSNEIPKDSDIYRLTTTT